MKPLEPRRIRASAVTLSTQIGLQAPFTEAKRASGSAYVERLTSTQPPYRRIPSDALSSDQELDRVDMDETEAAQPAEAGLPADDAPLGVRIVQDQHQRAWGERVGVQGDAPQCPAVRGGRTAPIPGWLCQSPR